MIKYIGLLLIVVGIPTLLLDQSANAEIPLLVGLFILFISKGKKDDERAAMIKTSSAYISLILGYGFALLSTNLYSHGLIPFQLTAINHFLILVFSMAILIYYPRIYYLLK